MANKKIQMQDSKGNIIYPATVSELVTYGSGNVNDTLVDLEARDELFISDTAPDKDGLWVDTSDQNSSPNGENIVATQIKKYIDEKITSKVDDCVEKVDEMEKDILSTNFNHIVTNQYSTALTDTKNGFANHEIIEGNTLQNYFVISNKTVTNENIGGERFTFYQNLQQQAVQVDGVYTLVNLSDKKLVLSKFNISTTAWDCEITLNPSEKKVINMGTISRFNAMFGRVEEGWTQDNCHLLPTSVLLLKGDWSDKEVPYRYFNGLASVGEHQPISIAVVSEDEPHKEEIQLIHEPLRAIGEIKDTIDVDRGVVIRRIGKVILDGSSDEDWVKQATSSSTTSIFGVMYGSININNIKIDPNDIWRKNISCDLFRGEITSDIYNNVQDEHRGMLGLAGQSCNFVTDILTLDEWKTWVSKNPITVLYELEIPIEEKINIAPLRLFEEARSVELVSNIKPTVTFNYPTNFKGIVESNTNAINKLYDERTIASNPNLLINGDLKIWQRGTQFVDRQGYCADRWSYICWSKNGAKGSVERDGNALKITNFNGEQNYIEQIIESSNTLHLSGKVVTLSAKIKGSNLTSGDIFIQIVASNGIDRINHSQATTKMKKINYSNITESYKSLSVTFTLPENTTNIAVQIGNHASVVGACNSNAIVNITDVKLEVGDRATPFVPRSYAEELRDCQRYYVEYNSYNAWLSMNVTHGNYFEILIPTPTTMRKNPTVINNVNGALQYYSSSDWLDVPAISYTLGNGFIRGAGQFTNETPHKNYLIKWIPSFDAEIY